MSLQPRARRRGVANEVCVGRWDWPAQVHTRDCRLLCGGWAALSQIAHLAAPRPAFLLAATGGCSSRPHIRAATLLGRDSAIWNAARFANPSNSFFRHTCLAGATQPGHAVGAAESQQRRQGAPGQPRSHGGRGGRVARHHARLAGRRRQRR
eukprot:351034-Chlamydomonas_euryale.AAC.7